MAKCKYFFAKKGNVYVVPVRKRSSPPMQAQSLSEMLASFSISLIAVCFLALLYSDYIFEPEIEQ